MREASDNESNPVPQDGRAPSAQVAPDTNQAPTDRGSGYVLVQLDYGTGVVRVTHDNLDVDGLVALSGSLDTFVGQMVDKVKEEAIRSQVLAELRAGEGETARPRDK